MKSKILTLIFLLPISLTATQFSSDPPPEFALITRESGIELYERWLVLEGEIDRREVMLTVQISAPTDEVIQVLMDENLGTRWNSYAEEYKIAFFKKTEWISYMKYNFPFPLSDRECYLSNLLVENGQNQTIYFKSSESRQFSNKEITQITGLEGSWIAKRREGGTNLEYRIISVPDGSLPRWLVDPIIRKSLLKTIYNLRDTIEGK